MDSLGGGSWIDSIFSAGFLVYFALLIFGIIVNWKVYVKAGKPGWACIIPIYSTIILLEIINKPLWWLLMLLIPGVNIVFAMLLAIELAKSFGKDTGFAVGMILLSPIFMGILAFGAAEYTYPADNTPEA